MRIATLVPLTTIVRLVMLLPVYIWLLVLLMSISGVVPRIHRGLRLGRLGGGDIRLIVGSYAASSDQSKDKDEGLNLLS